MDLVNEELKWVWDEYQSTRDINFMTNYIEQNYKKEFIDFVLMWIKDELENFRIKDFINGVNEFRSFSQDFSLLLQRFLIFLDCRGR